MQLFDCWSSCIRSVLHKKSQLVCLTAVCRSARCWSKIIRIKLSKLFADLTSSTSCYDHFNILQHDTYISWTDATHKLLLYFFSWCYDFLHHYLAASFLPKHHQLLLSWSNSCWKVASSQNLNNIKSKHWCCCLDLTCSVQMLQVY